METLKRKMGAVFAKVEKQLRLPARYCNDVFDIRIVRIDGCPYLVGYTYAHGISTIVHKGDCDNPAHRQSSENTAPANSEQTSFKEKLGKMTLAELEEKAFPKDHPVSLIQLREYAYEAKDANFLYELSMSIESRQTLKHIRGCKYCQKSLDILKAVDPILNGEDEKRTKVLIETVGKLEKPKP